MGQNLCAKTVFPCIRNYSLYHLEGGINFVHSMAYSVR